MSIGVGPIRSSPMVADLPFSILFNEVLGAYVLLENSVLCVYSRHSRVKWTCPESVWPQKLCPPPFLPSSLRTSNSNLTYHSSKPRVVCKMIQLQLGLAKTPPLGKQSSIEY